MNIIVSHQSASLRGMHAPSMPSAHIWSKWLLYICAYTRKSLRTIVRTVSRKFLGNGIPKRHSSLKAGQDAETFDIPILFGNIVSSSNSD